MGQISMLWRKQVMATESCRSTPFLLCDIRLWVKCLHTKAWILLCTSLGEIMWLWPCEVREAGTIPRKRVLLPEEMGMGHWEGTSNSLLQSHCSGGPSPSKGHLLQSLHMTYCLPHLLLVGQASPESWRKVGNFEMSFAFWILYFQKPCVLQRSWDVKEATLESALSVLLFICSQAPCSEEVFEHSFVINVLRINHHLTSYLGRKEDKVEKPSELRQMCMELSLFLRAISLFTYLSVLGFYYFWNKSPLSASNNTNLLSLSSGGYISDMNLTGLNKATKKLYSFLEAFRVFLFPCSFRLSAEFCSLWL